MWLERATIQVLNSAWFIELNEGNTGLLGEDLIQKRIVPCRTRRDKTPQAETTLTSRPTSAGEPDLLAATDRWRQSDPPDRNKDRPLKRNAFVAWKETVGPYPAS